MELNGKQARNYLFAILIIASFLRLYNLMPADNSGVFSPPGLYPDEAMNGNNAVEAISSGNWKVFYSENFGREGLFINIQSLSIMAFGNTPWALRLPSALFGIFTVLGLYFLVRELFRREDLALFSTFLIGTSFWHLMFSRIGFRAIMAPFFLVWSVYLLLRTLRAIREEKWTPSAWLRLSALGGAVFGLGMYSYIAYRATPLLIVLIAYLCWKNFPFEFRPKILRAFAVFFISAFIVSIPLLNYFWNNPADFLGRTSGISIFNSTTPFFDLGFNVIKTAGMFNVAGDFNWRHNFAGRPELFLPVGLFFLYGIFLGIREIRRKKSDAFPELILFGWLAAVTLPVVISNEGLPHALRAILMIPPVFILAAVGGIKAFEFFRQYASVGTMKFLAFIFSLLLVAEVFTVYFVAWSNHPAVKDSFAFRDYIISEKINSLPKETLKIVSVSGTDRTIERDYPISLQSVLFLTDTFSVEKRAEKNVIYMTPELFKSAAIPAGAEVISL